MEVLHDAGGSTATLAGHDRPTATSVVVDPGAKAKASRKRPLAKAAHRWPAMNGCRVAVSIALPDTTKYVPSDELRSDLLEALRGRCPAIVIDRHALTVAFVAAAVDPVSAGAEACAVVPELTGILGRDSDAVIQIRVESSEATGHAVTHSEHAEGDHGQEVPPCVGVGEAAELLGVSKQRLHQLARTAPFPSPVMRLRATPVWLRDDVLAYSQTRKRTPGPAAAS